MANREDNLIKLHGLRSIIGRSVVVHQNPEYHIDENGDQYINPGGRLACATVTLASEEPRV